MNNIRYARAAGDVSIAYEEFGSGPPDMLWVGGWVTNLVVSTEWAPALRFNERIGQFCRLIVFDKRGVGVSDRPPQVSPEDVLEDISAVAAAAGCQRFSLFGTPLFRRIRRRRRSAHRGSRLARVIRVRGL